MVSELVLWMKQLLKEHWIDLLYVVGITFLMMIPYLFYDILPVAHDTIFHVSRIEQLSRSIQEGNWFPAIYPYVNISYGYASALFYSDALLIPAALLHIAGLPLNMCFKFLIIIATLVSAAGMYHCAWHISHKRSIAVFASAGYLFANYHITDIFVRNALGEVFALMFLPFVLEGMYRILWNNEKKWGILAFGLAGLAISHDLTFLLGIILCIFLFLARINSLTKEKFIALTKGVLTAFLLTAFFTLPMIEQLKSQTFVLSKGQDLASGSMAFWQYFVNLTVYGMSGNDLPAWHAMTVNVGWFLTFAPLLYIFFDHQKKEHPFITCLVIIGYITMLLPAKIIPWNDLTVFKVLQFPWRLNTIAVTCLSLPAAYGIVSVCKKKTAMMIAEGCLLIEAVIHIIPACNRNVVGFTSSTTWNDVLNGAVLDPWYGSTYLFVELAGADYLPINSPDFSITPRAVRDEQMNSLNIEFTQESTTLTFTADDEVTSSFILPLTYYKGYQVYKIDGNSETAVSTYETENGLVGCSNEGSGEYVCRYVDTPVRKASLITSFLTAIYLLIDQLYLKRIKRKEDSH